MTATRDYRDFFDEFTDPDGAGGGPRGAREHSPSRRGDHHRDLGYADEDTLRHAPSDAIIGEAVRHLPHELKRGNPDIPCVDPVAGSS